MPTLAESTSKSVEQLGLRRVDAISGQNYPSPDVFPDPGVEYTRCPVPPVSISPDSLSTYSQKGLIPQARFLASLPLFQETGAGEGGSTAKTISAGSGGSFGAGSTSPTPTASGALPTNTGLTTPSINQNVPFFTTVQMSPLFILYKVTVNSPARVELYSTSSFQTLDQGRAATTPVSIGSENGIIGDFNLAATTESPWTCSPAPTGFNGDDPISSSIYVTVTNLTASSIPITVSLFYLPLGEV